MSASEHARKAHRHEANPMWTAVIPSPYGDGVYDIRELCACGAHRRTTSRAGIMLSRGSWEEVRHAQ